MQRQYNSDSNDSVLYTTLVSLGVCLRTGSFINPINEAINKRTSPIVDKPLEESINNLFEKIKSITFKDKRT